ncbi:MAG: hypothetical protein H0V18_08150 [Pyrinomonadaceae bacterium]|nr:hypothetical protein [Pyrinomonadaceae bacterium]
MTRKIAIAGLSAALAVTAVGCGSDELTDEQRLAYRQVAAYWTDPEAVVLKSFDKQQAAAEQFKRNLRELQGADLGEKQDAALRTLSMCTYEVTDGSEPTDRTSCESAFATVRSAVDERLE